MNPQDLSRWTLPELILVATDLHDLDRLLPVAIEQARESGARLILLHVLAVKSRFSWDAMGMPYYDPVGSLEFVDKALLPWCESARREGVTCDALVREGVPAQQISAAVRQFKADRVLLGTRSRSKLSKLLLGSVAEQVLRSVNVPVITVGPEAHLQVEKGGTQVVLHATALRETSCPGAALACRIAARRGQSLLLLHVLPPVDLAQRNEIPTRFEAEAMSELGELASRIAVAGCPKVEPLVIHGNPFIEILATASERNASLIVLGSMDRLADRPAFENFTRDRIIYRVLAHARCPVLTLRDLPRVSTLLEEEQPAALHN